MNNLIAMLAQHSTDLAAITETSGRLLYLDHTARRILGVDGHKDLSALHIQEILPGKNNSRNHAGGRDAGNSSLPFFRKIEIHRGPDGRIQGFSYYSPELTGAPEEKKGRSAAAEGLQAWIRATNAIVAARTEDRVIRESLKAVTEMIGCRMAVFCEFSANRDHGFQVRQHYASEAFTDDHIQQMIAPMQHSAFQNLLEHQQALRMSEAFTVESPGSPYPPENRNGQGEMLCARIFTEQNRTRGVIAAWEPTEAGSGQDTEALLVQLASFTSLALQRFRARRISDHMSLEMSQVFSALAEPVIVYDAAGIPIMANPATVAMMGFDPEGMPWETFVQKKQLLYTTGRPVPFEQLPCHRALSGSPVRGEKYRRTAPGGEDRIYEFNAMPLMRDGQIVGAVTVARDETERTRLMDQLETERTALQAIINNAPEAIVVADEECRIIMANPAARQLYQQALADGAAGDETLHFSGLSAPFDPVDLPLARSVFHGEMIVDHELTVTAAGGEKFHILVNTAPIRSPKGTVTGAVGVFHDITQRQRERLELQRSRAELEKRVAERTAELRHTVETLQNEIEERKGAEAKLQDSEERLRRLSHNMLQTLESDRQKIAKELHDSLGASLAAIKFSLEEKLASMPPDPPDKVMSLENIVSYLMGAIKETKRISANLRPTILDDLGLLATITWFCREFNSFYNSIRIVEQIDIREDDIEEPLKIVIYRIMQEAMNNAAKHGQPDTLELSLKKAGSRIELTVTDNGTGFDPENRLQSADPISGHGLQGMRERANVCGGEFEIKSRPGAGTRVRASFPPSPERTC